MQNIIRLLQKLLAKFLEKLQKGLARLRWILFYLRFLWIFGLWKDLFLFSHLSLLIWGSFRELDSIIKMRMLLAIILSRILIEIWEDWPDLWEFHSDLMIWLCFAWLLSLALLLAF